MSDFFDDFQDDFADEGQQQPDYSFFEEEDDAFDQLRQPSARASSAFDEDMEMVADDGADSSGRSMGFSLGAFTPGQRLILALLFVADIVMIAIGVWIVFG